MSRWEQFWSCNCLSSSVAIQYFVLVITWPRVPRALRHYRASIWHMRMRDHAISNLLHDNGMHFLGDSHWLLSKWCQTRLLPCVAHVNVFCWLLNSSCYGWICSVYSLPGRSALSAMTDFVVLNRRTKARMKNCKFFGPNKAKKKTFYAAHMPGMYAWIPRSGVDNVACRVVQAYLKRWCSLCEAVVETKVCSKVRC